MFMKVICLSHDQRLTTESNVGDSYGIWRRQQHQLKAALTETIEMTENCQYFVVTRDICLRHWYCLRVIWCKASISDSLQVRWPETCKQGSCYWKRHTLWGKFRVTWMAMWNCYKDRLLWFIVTLTCLLTGHPLVNHISIRDAEIMQHPLLHWHTTSEMLIF